MVREARRDGRHRRSDGTRRQLLGAAARLFGELGYAGTTLERIAERARVNKALIRYHFGGKKGLYSAVLLEGIATGRELLAPVRDLERPAPERLEAYIDALGAFFEQRPYFAPTIVREWMSGGVHVEPDVMAEFMHFFQVDREILELGVQNGELRATDAHATHLTLVGSLVFFEITRAVREERPRQEVPPLLSESFRESVKDLLRRGLAP